MAINLSKLGICPILTSSSKIAKEKMFDGFYMVSTNLEGSSLDIIEINKKRWEIEESFRIMKTEFKTRPVYLQKDDRIKAHFLTCFLALLVYRILEKRLGETFTSTEIISTLKNMKWKQEDPGNYTPAYERTEITDLLHESFDFRTDYQLFDNQMVKKLKKYLKNPKR